MNEHSLMQHIMVAASKVGARLLRNNTGKFQDQRGTWVAFGVGGPGGADLIGWRTKTVTQDMVGKPVAIFTAVEVKSGSGKLTKEQTSFLSAVMDAGGIAICARSVSDVVGSL